MEQDYKVTNVSKEYSFIGNLASSSDIIARSETFDKNLCSSEETAECMLILTQLISLRDCYRQDWKPNLKDRTNKYFIKNYNDTLCVRSTISESNMLSFQSEKVRDLFLKNFRNLIEKVKDFI